ncbi:histone acetyl transferase HAT1-like protein [Biscogniauxia sp. FL1348]|nr:histone acetyl transferase HAT1-like protein [Biscogniauxia sp. FL1348]
MDDEWTVSSNEALTLSLVRPTSSGVEKIESFNPKFTYAIFGEDERIFGYKGLRINLQFDARDLRPNVSIASLKKFTAVGDVESLDVKTTLKDFLPGVAFQSRREYEQAISDIPDTWTPPGTLIKTYEKNGETYEIWQGTMADKAVKQLVKRIQIVVLLFIEGGSYIGEDADGKDEPVSSLARWSVFFVYKKQANPEAADKHQYTFQGFSTVYDFWLYQQPSPPSSPGQEQAAAGDTWVPPEETYVPYMSLKSLPKRARISQFVILPPFQGKGIGALLYNTIFDLHMNDATTKEITVEDPNEDFDLLRDLCDLKYLRKNVPEFAALEVNGNVAVPEKGGTLHHNTQISSSTTAGSAASGIVDIAALEKLRVKTKIAPRQFWRLVEMHLMSKLPDSVRQQADEAAKRPNASARDKQVYTLWRLLLKQRIYRRNAAVLGEFEITERILKLNETVANVEWEYARILERLEPKSVVSNGKRKLDGDADVDSPSSKRARVEEA